MTAFDITWDAPEVTPRWAVLYRETGNGRRHRGRRARRSAFYARRRTERRAEHIIAAVCLERQAEHDEAMRAAIVGLPVWLSTSDGQVKVLTL